MNREAAQRYQADISSGLSQEQVQERIDSGWTNEMVTEESKTVGQIIKGNLLTYFNLIFTAQEHEILNQYFRLYFRADNMERKHIYFRGHTDCFSYLEKIEAFKKNNLWERRRNSTPLLHI